MSRRRCIARSLAVLPFVLASAGTARAQDRSGVRPEVMALPAGPGSIEGLGESFDANPQSGAASYRVPIRMPPAVAGFAPSLALSYSSGGGNSEVGLGWSLGLPMVQRNTDRGLPAYDATDMFVLRGMGGAGAEDLVKVADGRYRFRIEGTFARGEQRADGTWEFRNKSGVKFVFGEGSASTVRDGSRVFSWCLTRQVDTHGNEIAYEYERDSTDRPYLSRIVYNDFAPEVRNEIALVYEARPDTLTSYVSTFAVTTARRLARIEVRHGGETILTYSLGYDMAMDLSRLASVHLVGRDGVTDLPVLRLSYAEPDTDAASVVTMVDAPARALGEVAEIDDVDGDALPDLLMMDPSIDGGRYSWYPNLDGLRFDARQVMSTSPSVWLDSSGVQLADMDGDGAADVVARLSSASDGFRYYPAGPNGEFGAAVTISPNPSFAFDDPDLVLIDLNHDRLSDWLRIDPSTGTMSAGFNQGGGDFSPAVALGRLDPAEVLSFSGGDLSVADMNGDGLTDLVSVRSLSVRYWPAMGNGRFDEAVELPGAPVLSGVELAELHIRDLNGDGLSDLTHVGVNQVRWWRNVSGRSLAAETVIVGTPQRRLTTVIRVADMNGNGSGDIVWMDPADTAAPWRYLDVLGDGSPGLLARIDNGLGEVTTIEYAGLGQMRAWARNEGLGWNRRCPVGQQLVRKIDVDDSLGSVTTTEYRYADAHYDGAMREVRGFARAHVHAIGDVEQPTLVTEMTFDVGDSDEARKGHTLTVTRKTESGGIFDVAETTYEVRTLPGGLRYAVAVREDTEVFDLGTTPRRLRTEWDYDQYGNVTREASYGEVVGDDVAAGDDERIVERSYAINEQVWIVSAVASETVRSLAGERLAETRTYYDGEPHEGLPLGEVGVRGAPSRITSWVRGDEFVLEQSFARDAYGNATVTLDGRGGRTESAYDDASHTLTTAVRQFVSDDSYLLWSSTHDHAFGVMTQLTDPNGNTHRATYDGLGRVTSIVRPGDTVDLPTVRYEYSLVAPTPFIRTEQRETSGEQDVLVTYAYVDGLGRERGLFERAGGGRFAASGIVAFGPRGRVRYEAHPYFAASADLLPVDDSRDGEALEYDALGRVVLERNADGTARRTTHAPLETTTYDENDDDPASPHFDTPLRVVTDGLGRVRRSVELDGSREVVTSFRYDALGNLDEVEDAEGHIRSYRFDGRSRLATIVDPNAGTWRYEYDGANALTRRIDGAGNVVRFVHDRAGRVLEEWHRRAGDDAESLSVRYDYDATTGCPEQFGNLTGRVAAVDDEAGRLCFGYDARGHLTDRLRRWDDGDEHFTWTDYDAADRVVRRGYPDGTYLPHSYDERGLPRALGGLVLDATWTPWGTPDTVQYGNGVTDTRGYDRRLRVESMRASNARGAPVRDIAFSLDAASMITRVQDDRPGIEADLDLSSTYVYDDRYRLVQATDAAATTNWTYDNIGKILSVTSGHAASHLNVTNRYGEGNAGPDQLTSFGDESISYDAAGRTTEDGSRVLEWDAKGRIARIETSNGVVEFTYAYDDRRALKREVVDAKATTTRYIDKDVEERAGKLVRYAFFDGARVVRLDPTAGGEPLTSAANGGPTTRLQFAFLLVLFVVPLARRRGPISLLLVLALAPTLSCGGSSPSRVHDGTPVDQWPREAALYLGDHQGTVVAVADAEGELIQETSYHPYGTVRATRETPIDVYGYVGNERDRGTGLGDFQARPYRYDVARFMSVDPMALEPGPSKAIVYATLPAYGYSRSNPIVLYDPDGNEGKYTIVTRRFAPWKEFGGGFKGDNRGFSTKRDVSSKTVQETRVDVKRNYIIGKPRGYASRSAAKGWFAKGLSLTTFWRDRDTADVEVDAQQMSKETASALAVGQSSAGSIPLVWGAPDIDTHSFIVLERKRNTLYVSGFMSGDSFPNAEIFLVDENGATVPVMQFETEAGKAGPYYKLFFSGDGNDFARFRVRIPLNEDGTFKNGDNDSGWTGF